MATIEEIQAELARRQQAEPSREDEIKAELARRKNPVPVDQSIAPPEVKQDAMSSLQKPMFSPNTLKTLQQGSETLGKNIGEFTGQMISKAAAVPNIISKMNGKEVLPAPEPTTLGGKIGAQVGPFFEPVSLALGGLGGKIGTSLAEKFLINKAEQSAAQEGLVAAKYAIDRAAGEAAVSKMTSANLIKGAAHGAAAGGVTGAAGGAMENLDEKRSGSDAVGNIVSKGLIGTTVGTLLGVGAGAYGNRQLRKMASEIPEAINVANTPAHEELGAQLERLAAERGNIEQSIDRVTGLSPKIKAVDQQINANQSVGAELRRGMTARTNYPEMADPSQPIKNVMVVDTQGNATQVKSLEDAMLVPDAQDVHYRVGDANFERRIDEVPHMQAARNYDPEKAINELPQVAEQDKALRIQKAKLLSSDRQKMLGELTDPNVSQEKVAELSQKLRTNLEQHAALSAAQDQMGGFITGKAPTSTFAVNQGIEIAQKQYDKAREVLTKTGLFSKDQINSIASAEFKNAIDATGLKVPLFNPAKLGGISNEVERLSALGKMTGTNAGEIPLRMIFAGNAAANEHEQGMAKGLALVKDLRSRGWDDQKITKTLTYFEGENGFNPAPVNSRSMKREAWTMPPPSPQDQQSFQQLRNLLDSYHTDAVKAGALEPSQYVPGYVPLMSREGAPIQQGRSAQGLISPRFAEERISGVLDPNFHEVTPEKWLDRYSKQVIAAKHFAPIAEDGAREIVKLKLMGQDGAAKTVENYLRSSLKLKTDVPIEQLLGHHVVASQVDRLTEAGVPLGAFDQIYKEAANNFFKATVQSNPKVMLLHAIQPEVLLPLEVGGKEYAYARAQAAMPKKWMAEPTQKLLTELMPKARIGVLPAAEELLSGKTTNPIAKVLQTFGNITDKTPQVMLFNGLENLKRKTALLAGYNKFMSAAEEGGFPAVQRAMSHFLPSEQSYIEKAYRDGGSEAGAKAMALIVDRRVNFSYSSADKPELLKTGLAQYIPYTTIYRNLIARYQGDLQNGNYAQLAKRIAQPMMIASVLEKLTGKDFEEITPGNAVKKAVSGQSILPAIAGPAGMALKSPQRLPEQLLNFTPAGGTYRTIQNVQQGKGIFGLKDTNKDYWLRGLLR